MIKRRYFLGTPGSLMFQMTHAYSLMYESDLFKSILIQKVAYRLQIFGKTPFTANKMCTKVFRETIRIQAWPDNGTLDIFNVVNNAHILHIKKYPKLIKFARN